MKGGAFLATRWSDELRVSGGGVLITFWDWEFGHSAHIIGEGTLGC